MLLNNILTTIICICVDYSHQSIHLFVYGNQINLNLYVHPTLRNENFTLQFHTAKLPLAHNIVILEIM